MRIWFNGRMCEEAEARVSPFDRGFLFGDAVYEGIRFFNRVGVGMDLHVRRLARSLEITGIRGFDPSTLDSICQTLLEDSNLSDAGVYLQVSRGVQLPRDHQPAAEMEPTVFGVAGAAPSLDQIGTPHPRRCLLVEDQRWRRCDIKSVNLLANVMAIMEAREAKADEPILHRNGLVGEGAMTNVFIVKDGALMTPPIDDDPSILHGVTRAMLLEVATGLTPDIIETTEIRPITVEELRRADEVMIASSRRLLDSVVEVDGQSVGIGTPGPVASALLAKMQAHLAESCGVALHS